MSDGERFHGFPAVGKATAIPHTFFSFVLPRLESASDLLAFLWAARILQERRGDQRFVTAAEVMAQPGAGAAFARMSPGADAGVHGLDRCVAVGALLALDLDGPGGVERVYLVNEPGSRRLAARARAREVVLRPGAAVLPPPPADRPTVFQLYEQNVGTITPVVAERLLWAAETYPWEWVEDAFREAAELNKRNWRYIERILQNWSEEGRGHEAPGRDPGEAQRERYLGGAMGHVIRNR